MVEDTVEENVHTICQHRSAGMDMGAAVGSASSARSSGTREDDTKISASDDATAPINVTGGGGGSGAIVSSGAMLTVRDVALLLRL